MEPVFVDAVPDAFAHAIVPRRRATPRTLFASMEGMAELLQPWDGERYANGVCTLRGCRIIIEYQFSMGDVCVRSEKPLGPGSMHKLNITFQCNDKPTVVIRDIPRGLDRPFVWVGHVDGVQGAFAGRESVRVMVTAEYTPA